MIFVGSRRTGQLRVGNDGGEAVTGHIDFREDVYKAVFGVFHQFVDIVRGIKAAVVSFLVRRAGSAKLPKVPTRFCVPGAHLGQAGRGL